MSKEVSPRCQLVRCRAGKVGTKVAGPRKDRSGRTKRGGKWKAKERISSGLKEGQAFLRLQSTDALRQFSRRACGANPISKESIPVHSKGNKPQTCNHGMHRKSGPRGFYAEGRICVRRHVHFFQKGWTSRTWTSKDIGSRPANITSSSMGQKCAPSQQNLSEKQCHGR